MPTITPTLNLPQPPVSSPKTSAAVAAPVAAPAPTPAASTPSATVTLSPQAMSAAWATSHPTASAGSTAATPATPAAAPAPHDDGSVYESLKNGISAAVTDVGDAIASGAHAVVDGVETTLSTANKVAKGILELPFAAVAKGCDAVGSLIDEL